jgi:hypothetical protein
MKINNNNLIKFRFFKNLFPLSEEVIIDNEEDLEKYNIKIYDEKDLEKYTTYNLENKNIKEYFKYTFNELQEKLKIAQKSMDNISNLAEDKTPGNIIEEYFLIKDQININNFDEIKFKEIIMYLNILNIKLNRNNLRFSLYLEDGKEYNRLLFNNNSRNMEDNNKDYYKSLINFIFIWDYLNEEIENIYVIRCGIHFLLILKLKNNFYILESGVYEDQISMIMIPNNNFDINNINKIFEIYKNSSYFYRWIGCPVGLKGLIGNIKTEFKFYKKKEMIKKIKIKNVILKAAEWITKNPEFKILNANCMSFVIYIYKYLTDESLTCPYNPLHLI